MTRPFFALALSALTLAACGPDRPDGWTESTHGKVTPNYAHIFDQATVHEFLITVAPEDYERTMEDLDANLSGGGPVTNLQVSDPIWVPVTVALDGVEWWHVGMRYKGNSSLRSAWQSGVHKLAFRLDFEK